MTAVRPEHQFSFIRERSRVILSPNQKFTGGGHKSLDVPCGTFGRRGHMVWQSKCLDDLYLERQVVDEEVPLLWCRQRNEAILTLKKDRV
jgi:hypothetical protein